MHPETEALVDVFTVGADSIDRAEALYTNLVKSGLVSLNDSRQPWLDIINDNQSKIFLIEKFREQHDWDLSDEEVAKLIEQTLLAATGVIHERTGFTR